MRNTSSSTTGPDLSASQRANSLQSGALEIGTQVAKKRRASFLAGILKGKSKDRPGSRGKELTANVNNHSNSNSNSNTNGFSGRRLRRHSLDESDSPLFPIQTHLGNSEARHGKAAMPCQGANMSMSQADLLDDIRSVGDTPIVSHGKSRQSDSPSTEQAHDIVLQSPEDKVDRVPNEADPIAGSAGSDLLSAESIPPPPDLRVNGQNPELIPTEMSLKAADADARLGEAGPSPTISINGQAFEMLGEGEASTGDVSAQVHAVGPPNQSELLTKGKSPLSPPEALSEGPDASLKSPTDQGPAAASPNPSESSTVSAAPRESPPAGDPLQADGRRAIAVADSVPSPRRPARMEPRDPVVPSRSTTDELVALLSTGGRTLPSQRSAMGMLGRNPRSGQVDESDGEREGSKSRRLSMLDFLSSEPPHETSSDLPPPSPKRSSMRSLGKRRSVQASPSKPSPTKPTPSASAPLLTNWPSTTKPRDPNAITPSSAPIGSLDAGGRARPTVLSPEEMSDRDDAVKWEFVSARETGESKTAGKRREMERASSFDSLDNGREILSLVTVSVEPLIDEIVMFGSTQTSSNYSLSGNVVLTLPRCSPSRAGLVEGSPSNLRPVSIKAATSVDRQVEGLESCSAKPPVQVTDAGEPHERESDGANVASGFKPPGKVSQKADETSGDMASNKVETGMTGPSLPLNIPVRSGSFSATPTASSPLALSSATLSGPVCDPLAERLEPKRPSVRIDSLKVNFSGYALYVDYSGRFNSIKLADVTQELLPQGATLYMDGVDEDRRKGGGMLSSRLGNGSENEADIGEAVKYDIHFDLSVPGWLPATMRSRFGGTFYCITAEAIVDGTEISLPNLGPKSTAPSRLQNILASERPAMFSDESGIDLISKTDGGLQQTDAPVSTRKALLKTGSSDAGNADSSQTRKSWLGKRAKHLGFKTKKPTGLFGGAKPGDSSADDGDRSGQSSRRNSVSRPPGSSKSWLLVNEAGQWKRKIECPAIAIVIRRCRDVVPVPVARMALIGDDSNLASVAADASSDGPNRRAMAETASGAQGSVTTSIASPQARSVPAAKQSLTSAAAGSNRMAPFPPGALDIPPFRGTRTALPGASPVAAGGHSPSAGSATRSERTAPSTNGPRSPLPILPVAPNAFDAPTDPNKLAATVSSSAIPIPPNRANMDPGRLRPTGSPPRTTSRTSSRQNVPMRHFLHRPVIHPLAELGIGPEGLPFSLTLSLPSHVHVQGPSSDTLTFGVQIEVGRAPGWSQVKKLGGLRLRDMELVCLQTEKHR
ncbi:hypothetical protein IE53DRAFT_369719 [Violaceomyces palustris]|uniref:Uncharacterized protein n=1 Tax=Violaceomyces palustris TaxID=1673888 RepID=A0ACD0NUI2_9BASI|nr:hypothetical protein IE53DRAFT_369719 [Violaceomyces palustris]